MALFIYANDIIIEPRPGINETGIMGVGALMTDESIYTYDFNKTLNTLDPYALNADPMDRKTVKRGFFQPKEDSTLARTLCCESINQFVKGVFITTFFKENATEVAIGRTARILNQFLNTFAVRIFASQPIAYLDVLGDCDGSDQYLNAWQGQLHEQIHRSQVQNLGFKSFYPSINFAFGTNHSPGQISVDMLLLAASKSQRNVPDNSWLNKLKFKSTQWHSDGEALSNQFFINIPITHFNHPYQEKLPDDRSRDKVFFGLAVIERFFANIKEAQFNDHNRHLLPIYQSINNYLESNLKILAKPLAKLMIKGFLQLFDSWPVYREGLQTDQFQDLLLAKEVAVLWGLGDATQFEKLIETYNIWRQNITVNNHEEWQRLMRIFPGGG